MLGPNASRFIEIAGERYAVMHALPGSRLSREQLLDKYCNCDSMLINNKTGEVLICIKMVDVEVGEIIKYEDSSGHPLEGGGEIQNADTERREEIGPPDNDGERTGQGEVDNVKHEIRDSQSL